MQTTNSVTGNRRDGSGAVPHLSRPQGTPLLRSLALWVALTGLWIPVRASGQVENRQSGVQLQIGGRVHTQFNTTSVSDESGTEFVIRRARINFHAQLNPWLEGVVQGDFGPTRAVEGREMYFRATFNPALSFSLGQFKRGFDLFEITSSTRILVIERAGDIRGVEGCPGVGRICSYSRLSEALQYSSLDVGARLEGAVGDRVNYLFTVTNGPGKNTAEENSAKSLGARLTFEVAPDVVLGGNLSLHDYPNEITETDEHAPAYAFDVEVGNFNQGLHLQLGIMTGDNWRALDDDGSAPTFLTWQGIVTYKAVLEDNEWVQAIEPLVRLSWGDGNRDVSDDSGMLITPGLAVHFIQRTKAAVNVDIWSPATGDTEYSLKVQTFIYF